MSRAEDVASAWTEEWGENYRVIPRANSIVEVIRSSSSEGESVSGLVGWYEPDDGIAYGRIPIHVGGGMGEDAEVAVDAAIGCLEHFEDELEERDWQITDDGTLRRIDGEFVFEATVQSVVESDGEALRQLKSLADDPLAYEVKE